MAVNYPFQITSELYQLSFFDGDLNDYFNYYDRNNTLNNISDVINKYGKIGKNKNAKSDLLYSYISLIYYLTYLKEQLRSLNEKEQNKLLEELNATDFKCFKDNFLCKGGDLNKSKLNNNICGCLTYNLETGYYDLPCTPNYTIEENVLAPIAPSFNRIIEKTLPNNYNGKYFVYKLDGLELVSSNQGKCRYVIYEPEVIIDGTCFIIEYIGDREHTDSTGVNYTQEGLIINFPIQNKIILSTYRKYLLKLINKIWYAYDVTGTKYSIIDIFEQTLQRLLDGTDMLLQSSIHYRFRSSNTLLGRALILPNPTFSKNEYIKITTEPTFTIFSGTSYIVNDNISDLLEINTTYEYYSDGIRWNKIQ